METRKEHYIAGKAQKNIQEGNKLPPSYTQIPIKFAFALQIIMKSTTADRPVKLLVQVNSSRQASLARHLFGFLVGSIFLPELVQEVVLLDRLYRPAPSQLSKDLNGFVGRHGDGQLLQKACSD